MSIVSITKAAQLSGKSIRTIQRHLSNGKLSFIMTQSDTKGIDTSELIRVYGNIMSYNDTSPMSGHVIDQKTSNKTKDVPKDKPLEHQIELLKLELKAEKRLSDERLQTIDNLKTALKLLEHRQEKTETKPLSKEEQIKPALPENSPIDSIETSTPSTGFWSGFKKLFQ